MQYGFTDTSTHHKVSTSPTVAPPTCDLNSASGNSASIYSLSLRRKSLADYPFKASGQYAYIDDLLALDSCRPARPVNLPPRLCQVVTPLKPEAWKIALHPHPDRAFVHYILSGLQQGFRIGFDRRVVVTKSAATNMLSAIKNPEPVINYLHDEERASRIVTSRETKDIHLSRFGLIPKRNKPGKWRLILDLSYPQGASINDGVDRSYCHLSFPSVDDAARKII